MVPDASHSPVCRKGLTPIGVDAVIDDQSLVVERLILDMAAGIVLSRMGRSGDRIVAMRPIQRWSYPVLGKAERSRSKSRDQGMGEASRKHASCQMPQEGNAYPELSGATFFEVARG